MVEIKAISDLFKMDTAEWKARDEEVMQWERAQAEKEKRRRYREQVPERYWNESIDTYHTDTEERQDVKAKTDHFMTAVKCGKFQTLIFLGSAGTGKTHLACGIIRECGGLYRLAPAIVEEIRRAKSFNAKETEAEILDSYGRVGLLVIDEIGRGVAAAEEQYMLYQIINERYNRRKPTVLISNQNKKDFLNYVGIAAADRLTESAQVVEFTGQSYRAVMRMRQNEAVAAGV
ncbi:MAG: ATP-binding protein [Treponema sp.]|nr:ATP-binding protein [Treponema sp.]